MKRRTATIAITLCLTATFLIVACWTRSLHARDEVVLRAAGRKWIISTFPHHAFVLGHIQPGPWRGESYQLGMAQYPAEPQYWELRYEVYADGLVRIGVPFWLLLLPFATPPAYWRIRRLQNSRRRRAGLCPTCGYDLRASRGRCPECGTPMPAGSAPAPALT